MGIYHELEDAKTEAREIHENKADGHIPVWVIASTFDEASRSWDVGMFPDRTTDETPGEWVEANGPDGCPKDEYPRPEERGWTFPGKTKSDAPTYRVTYNLGVDLKIDVEAPRADTARARGDEKIGSGFKGTLDDGTPFEAVVLHGDRVACEKKTD